MVIWLSNFCRLCDITKQFYPIILDTYQFALEHVWYVDRCDTLWSGVLTIRPLSVVGCRDRLLAIYLTTKILYCNSPSFLYLIIVTTDMLTVNCEKPFKYKFNFVVPKGSWWGVNGFCMGGLMYVLWTFMNTTEHTNVMALICPQDFD